MEHQERRPSKPTKLRLAIERAIARQQATQADASPSAPVATPPLPADDESLALLDAMLQREATLPAVELLEPIREPSALFLRSTEPETALPMPSQTPLQARNMAYQDAIQRLGQRDRDRWPIVPRHLEPISAAELGRVRPQFRSWTRQTTAPAITLEPLEDIPPALEVAPTPAGSVVVPRQPLPQAVADAIDPETLPPPELRRPPLSFAVAAGVMWALVFGWLLLSRNLGPGASLTTRILFASAVVAANLLTWVPVQWGLRLNALTWRGTAGWLMVLWWLAFLPGPTKALPASLAEVPVYLLLAVGLFLAFSAVALPILYIRRVRRGKTRREQYNLRRVNRQANEVGLFFALGMILAAMNILELPTVILLIAILGLSEMVFLSLSRA